MRLAQFHPVSKVQFRQHAAIITHDIIYKLPGKFQAMEESPFMLNLSPSLLISRIITLIIALTIHEFAHAFVAFRFGDTTARDAGRLTLNPLKHLDPIGSLMLLVAGFGWAKPVPINPYALRRRADSAVMWVSLAGPASNLLMAILAGRALRLRIFPWVASDGLLPSPAEFLFTFMTINLVLMLFNLIPLAPLDGEKVLGNLLPKGWADTFASIQRYGPILLLVLLFVLPMVGIDIISWIMTPALTQIQKVILGVS
jgi:Zn-dependent protease